MGICKSSNNGNKTKSELTLDNPNNSKQVISDSPNLQHTQSNKFDKDTNEKITLMPSLAIDSNLFIAQVEGSPLDFYVKEETLGEGSFGVVWLVKHKLMGSHRAMKIIKKQKKQGRHELDNEIMNEINILKKIDHPNIVKILEFYCTNNEYYLITEYCPEGELFKQIIDSAPFSEPFTAFIMYQLFHAIHHCHNLNIIHRDLKPENVLVDRKERNGYFRIKIIDFGTAKIFEKGHAEKRMIGSSYYIAPEVLNKNYNEKCDLWSCGVIMYILLTGRPPFGGEKDSDIMNKIRIGTYDLKSSPWDKISKEAKSLVTSLLQKDVDQRISAEQAMKHPWFELKNIRTKEKLNEIKGKAEKKLISNLKSYRGDKILQCAALAYLVHNNSQLEDVQDAIKLFNLIDTNGDGRITKQELYEGLQKYLAISEESLKEDVERIFDNIDNDRNGYVEYEEFIRAAIDKEKFLRPDILKFAFNFFDKDGSGEISPEELTKVFLGNEKNRKNPKIEEELNNLFKEIDANGDGGISFAEFTQVMKSILIS